MANKAPQETQEKNCTQMESTLLEKVEELTLYLIEQNKKVELLEKEVAKLKHK